MFLVSQLGLTDENFKKNTLSLSWQCSETGQCPQVLVSSKIGTSIEVLPAPNPLAGGGEGREEISTTENRAAADRSHKSLLQYDNNVRILCWPGIDLRNTRDTAKHLEL